jgi:hypothetical protein
MDSGTVLLRPVAENLREPSGRGRAPGVRPIARTPLRRPRRV